MAIRWTGSADKHGVDREDALHALLNHYLYVAEFDEPRVEGAGRTCTSGRPGSSGET